MYLPAPPSDKEVLLYLDAKKGFLYSFGVFSSFLLLIGGALFSIQKPSLYWYLIFVFMTFIYLGISYLVGFFASPFSHREHRKTLIKNGWFKPSVDILLPSCGEPLKVLRNTYHFVSKIHWLNLQVYVLDDSGRTEVKDLAYKYGFNYISRPDKGVLKKSGNLRHAFPLIKGDFMAIFDADFAPRADFLLDTIPYFVDEKIAIVQTPQFFRVEKGLSWVQKGSAAVQELFYRLIQVNRNHYGASICVGTNAVYRRAALEPFGGTYPIEHSEDVHTGFNLIKHGWKLWYIPLNLACGICPETIDSFYVQQYRWCSGSTSLFLNRELFWKTKLGFMARLSFLSGMLYYQATALSVLLMPLPGLITIYLNPSHVFWYNYIFSMPSFLFGTIHMRLWNKLPYGFSAMRTRSISYYAHLYAILDRLTSSTMEWIPSGVKKAKSGNIRRFRWSMAIWSIGCMALGLYGAAIHMGSIDNYNFYPYVITTSVYGIINVSANFDKK